MRPIPVITLGLLFEPQLRFIVHNFHAFILQYVLVGYFHVLPFADMWDIEHLGHSACTTGSICNHVGVLYISDHTNYMQTPRRRINKSMNYYMKPDYFRRNWSTFIKF